MSFTLAVWDAPRPPTVAEAAERHEQLRRGGDEAGLSPRITAFVEECERRWPGPADGGPWATWPLRRQPTGLLADIRPEAAAEMFAELGEMAERHGVVVYDPQSGVVKIPSRLSFDAQPPPRKPTRFGRR